MGVIAVVMAVVVFMAIERQRAARAGPEQRPVFWRRCDHRWRSFAADMTVETDDTVRCAHYDVQFMTNHKNGAARVLPHSFDLFVKGC
jgi:hypothetical protein